MKFYSKRLQEIIKNMLNKNPRERPSVYKLIESSKDVRNITGDNSRRGWELYKNSAHTPQNTDLGEIWEKILQ